MKSYFLLPLFFIPLFLSVQIIDTVAIQICLRQLVDDSQNLIEEGEFEKALENNVLLNC